MNSDLRHLATCARSGQMDSRQIAAHQRAGELPVRICDECETVRHCGKFGCIPKVPLPQFSLLRYVIGYLDIYLRYADHKAAKRAGHLAAITKG